MANEAAAQSILFETFKEISKPLVAELFGTAFLVFLGCGSTTGGDVFSRECVNLDISFSFGLTIALIVHNIRHISGGHINPAVTIGFFVAGNLSFIRTFLYIVSQSIGATIGAAVLFGVLPSELRTNLGQTKIDAHVKVGQGLAIEFLITFIFVYTVLCVCYLESRNLNGSVPMYIGTAITVCHILAVKYTGSSMNPARSFGPALVGNNWDDHWVYWLGPLSGGVAAGFVYKFVFKVQLDEIETGEIETEENP